MSDRNPWRMSAEDYVAIVESIAWIQADDDPDTGGECEVDTDIGTLIVTEGCEVWTSRYGRRDLQLR